MRVSVSGAAVLLVFGLVSWSRGEETIRKVSGSDVTFTADVSARPSEIIWFQGTSKIVDLEAGSEPHFYRLKGRAVADLTQGTLLLMGVSPADSGSYKAQLLIGGSYSYIDFSLQVFDHVCPVVIHGSTQKNNVMLWCTCSAPSADPPTKYQWYNRSRHVSDHQNITIQKEDKEQLLQCNASNAVSWTNATITVPPKDYRRRTHVAGICAVVLVFASVMALIFIVWRNRSKFSVQDTGHSLKPTPGLSGESLTPSEIVFKKAGESLMSIKLQSPAPRLERLSVRRDMLTIMDVKREDYAQYEAKVHLGETATTTRTFVCTQNAEIGQCDTAETELVRPENGELKMKIPNAANAERIVWSKAGAEILAVTCRPPAPEGLVLYKGALSTGLVSAGDETHWEDLARPDGTSVGYTFRLDDAARASGSLTLYPVIVGDDEQITWKKEGKVLKSRSAERSRGGALTLRNLKDCGGRYTMEPRGPKTPRQEFSLSILPEAAS